VTGGGRGRRGHCWTLLTPDNRYPSHLPGLWGGELFKLVTPRLPGAQFAESVVELQTGGTLESSRAELEHFLYVLEGEVALTGEATLALEAGGYAYQPPGAGLGFRAVGEGGARALWLQRRYEPSGELPAPAPDSGHRDDGPFAALEVPGLTRRELLAADDPSLDFTMSLLRFAPGAALDRIEIHDEEHGLYMTTGAGVYELDGERHAVHADDFIYMAPYCPQHFQASEHAMAEYLLYKDVHRDGF